jgi:hypothetical protein
MADEDRKCCKPNYRRTVKEGGHYSRGLDQYSSVSFPQPGIRNEA